MELDVFEFQELPHIPVLGQALQEGDVLEVAQRAVLITFLIQEISFTS